MWYWNLNSQSCASLGFFGGTLTCIQPKLINECLFDTTQCHNCGNNKCDQDEGETCDNCFADCSMLCGDCGNGIINYPPERCDTNGPVFPPAANCVALGYDGGTLSCDYRCQIDTSGCWKLHSSCGDGYCSVPGECTSCPIDCIGEPGCASAPNKMDVEISPASGSRQVDLEFSIDTNTEKTTPFSTKYTLVVDVMIFIGDWVSSSECRYNGGAYQSSITIGSGLSVGVDTYNFSCKTEGTYRLTFTVTNDSNAADLGSDFTDWVINNAGTVATPIASPLGGTYTSAQSITLSSATSGAAIWYTINGTDPDCNTGMYTLNSIDINPNGAYILRDDSEMSSQEYFLVANRYRSNYNQDKWLFGGLVNGQTLNLYGGLEIYHVDEQYISNNYLTNTIMYDADMNMYDDTVSHPGIVFEQNILNDFSNNVTASYGDFYTTEYNAFFNDPTWGSFDTIERINPPYCSWDTTSKAYSGQDTGVKVQALSASGYNVLAYLQSEMGPFNAYITYPKNNKWYKYNHLIDFTVNVNNYTGIVSCVWKKSNGDIISNECNFSATPSTLNLGTTGCSGSHELTVTATDSGTGTQATDDVHIKVYKQFEEVCEPIASSRVD